MLKLTKKADYGLIALRHLATRKAGSASAKDIADAYRIPLPLLSKVLQKLVRAGLLMSEQGTNGGYRLSRAPQEITALEVIRAIDGPIILTQCFTEHTRLRSERACARCASRCAKCTKESCDLLAGITIADLARDEMPIPGILSIQPSIGTITR